MKKSRGRSKNPRSLQRGIEGEQYGKDDKTQKKANGTISLDSGLKKK